MSERWREVWRGAVVPLLSTAGLEALAKALAEDSPTLLQGQTVDPPALHSELQRPVTAACAIGFACWKGEGLRTVGQVDAAFRRALADIDAILDEKGGCRDFLNVFDAWDRAEMVREMLPEVTLALDSRKAGAA